jgi:membrane protease YdiL (CAAX protease family)
MEHVMSDRENTRVASLAQDYPIATYFALTLTLSWSVWIPALLTQTGLGVILGSFGPALAAAVVTRLRGHSVRSWLRGSLDPRTDLRWYVAALGVPLAWAGVIVVGLGLWTGSVDTARLAGLARQLPAALLFVMLVGGGNEELGWRGFALPVLQKRTDALTASVIIGLVWAVWHLPMFVFGFMSYGPLSAVPAYIVNVVGISVVFTWLYNKSGPSILPAVVLHGMNNTVMEPAVGAGGFAAAVPKYLIMSAPIWATAFVVVAVYGRTRIADRLVDTTVGSHTSERGERV